MEIESGIGVLAVLLACGCSCLGCGDRDKRQRSPAGVAPPHASAQAQSPPASGIVPGDDHGDSYGTATKLSSLVPRRTDRPNPLDPRKPIEHYSPISANDSGALERDDDTDWFEGILKDRITYTVTVRTDQDTHVTVLGPRGQVVGEADSVSPQDGSSELTFTAAGNGYHYVIVRKGDATLATLANAWSGADQTLYSQAGSFEAGDAFDYTLAVRSRSYNAP